MTNPGSPAMWGGPLGFPGTLTPSTQTALVRDEFSFLHKTKEGLPLTGPHRRPRLADPRLCPAAATATPATAAATAATAAAAGADAAKAAAPAATATAAVGQPAAGAVAPQGAVAVRDLAGAAV